MAVATLVPMLRAVLFGLKVGGAGGAATRIPPSKLEFLPIGRKKWPGPFGNKRTWCRPPDARISGFTEFPGPGPNELDTVHSPVSRQTSNVEAGNGPAGKLSR